MVHDMAETDIINLRSLPSMYNVVISFKDCVAWLNMHGVSKLLSRLRYILFVVDVSNEFGGDNENITLATEDVDSIFALIVNLETNVAEDERLSTE